MHKFYVGQPVKVGPGADNGVGCLGLIASVSLCVCEVDVVFPTGTFPKWYFKNDLIPVEEGVTA